MTKISIVIVSYNVKYFLRQCLQSVYKSKVHANLEIIVTDNNSVDGSLEMLNAEFPEVTIISNSTNVGFSKANNQAFKIATGNYILILNPDTIIEESTLQICLDRITKDENIGAIGVKMLDGGGNFLPESKRGFPTPLRSFFKLLGLSSLIKNSSFFNGYYLGHQPINEESEIDVLTGAFMFCPSSVIKSINGFDEDYFMYGEDIEMCFQIKQLNKKIWYLPSTSIIHFKGESTKKSSISYMKNFYGAMAIYAAKRHRKSGWIWNIILKLGIFLTAMAGVTKRFLRKIIFPIFDFIILYLAAKTFQNFWAVFYHQNKDYYSKSPTESSLILNITALILIYFLFGHYDRKYNFRQLLYAFIFGSLTVLSLYAIYPIEWRFSRTVVLVTLILSPLILYASRRIYNKLFFGSASFTFLSDKRIAIVGTKDSYDKILPVAKMYNDQAEIIGLISQEVGIQKLGSFSEIITVIQSREINEIIFCTKDISSEVIFKTISNLGIGVSYKIANDDNSSILGSDSKDRVGEWYTMDIDFKIDQLVHRRTKRLVDLSTLLVFVIFFPIVFVFSKTRVKVYCNLINVLIGSKTWIGYNNLDRHLNDLPVLKEGVFSFEANKQVIRKNENYHQENLFYARNYSIWLELEQILIHTF